MSMKKKIVILTGYPFNRRDYHRFGVEILRKRGFFVEIWDISPIIYCENDSRICRENPEQFTNLKIFHQKDDIIAAISKLGSDCLINYTIEYTYRTFFILKAISKYRIDYCVWGFVTLPSPSAPVITSYPERIFTFFKKGLALNFSQIIQHFINKIILNYYPVFGIAPASIILLGGEKTAECLSYPVDLKTIRLWAHYLDYDIYLQHKSEPRDCNNKGGVFLDQYLPFHPDYIHMGLDFPIEPEVYYQNLCSFFSMLEMNMDSRIVIAAHPRSDYPNQPDYFCGRSIVKGQTAALVERSSFVITHTSTSIHYAILYHKPIILITNDRLEMMTSGKNILGLYNQVIARELNKTPINVDHEYSFDWDAEMRIDEVAYQRYKNLYIKKEGTPEKPVWEIFSSYLLEEKGSVKRPYDS
jgi:hypothetical protein